MDKVEKMLEEMKKVWNTELDCVCCRKTFRLGDMFAICGDCYTLFLKERKFKQKTYGCTDPSDISKRQTKTRLHVLR